VNGSPSSQAATPPPVFTFSPRPYFAGFRWFVWIFLAAGVAMALLEWFEEGNPSMLINLGLQVCLLAFAWRRILKPLPSSVLREGNDLIFRDVPSFWVNIQGIIVPLVVRKDVRVPVGGMVPEWIDQSLTWNDMEKGRTVYLARGQEAQALVKWLCAHGVAPPVGG